MTLESEMREMLNNVTTSERTNYEHKLHQDNEVAFDNEGQQRHDLEIELVTALKV